MGKAPQSESDWPDLGVGLGLRAPHYADILAQDAGNRPRISWFEAIAENYMGIEGGSSGRPLKILQKIRENHPIVLHGVSLSIGSADPLNRNYLHRLKELIHRTQPEWTSDHLCWTGVEGENLHDLLPLPYTGEALDHLVPRILEVQEFLGRRILLENVSSYVSFGHSEMTEWEFLAELAARADCGILLDINNIYVSSVNHGFDPIDFLNAIPAERVGQLHLAGHSSQGKILVDTHDHPVPDPVWALYGRALEKFPSVSTLVEWDANIPSFERLSEEAFRAACMRKEAQRNVSDESAFTRPLA